MSQSARQRRILRAGELAAEYPASAEILHFVAHVMRFQDEFHGLLERSLTNEGHYLSFADPIAAELAGFSRFLAIIEANGPAPLASAAQKLGNGGDSGWAELLAAFWSRRETAAPLAGEQEFFARAFLQPYAEFVRSRAKKQHNQWTPRLCPFCLRKPGSGVLRPLGDGGQRLLVCSFCLGEWEFRRIVCPACGEENELKLPVYTAEEFNHVRVECCDSCRCYIKTVDLTRNGLADPVIDEIAAIPLDRWAQQRGYSKLQTNLMLL
jgi:FdhE protein